MQEVRAMEEVGDQALMDFLATLEKGYSDAEKPNQVGAVAVAFNGVTNVLSQCAQCVCNNVAGSPLEMQNLIPISLQLVAHIIK